LILVQGQFSTGMGHPPWKLPHQTGYTQLLEPLRTS